MKSEKDILITVTDKKFIKGTQVMLFSFLTHNTWFKGDILILSDEDIGNLLKEKIRFASYFMFERINRNLIERVEELEKENNNYVKNKKTFYSLDSFRFINYKNIIFIDSDILFKSSIQELMDSKYSFIGVGDKPYYKNIKREKNNFSIHIKKQNSASAEVWNDSLNSGLFIVKTHILQQSIYHDILESISVDNFDKFKGSHHDQFIIFLHFRKKLHLVSAKFNYRFQIDREIKEKDNLSYHESAVIHFTGPTKPWNSIKELLPKLKNWNYLHSFIQFKLVQAKIARRNIQLKQQEKRKYKEIRKFADQNMISSEGVHTFCLFVGYARSGHTLIGALLDAHPNAAIATELDAFDLYEKGFSKSEIFSLIAERSKEMRNNKYMWTDYSYKVPNQFQGVLKNAKVMGVKHGGKLSKILKKDINYISRFNTFTEKLKLIHIIRNPYDIITTRVTRREQEIKQKISRKGIIEIMNFQFSQMRIVSALKAMNQYDMFDVTNEEFINNPSLHLEKLCDFLELEYSSDYIQDCSSIVFKKPTQTRFKVDWWDKELKRTVDDEIKKYPYFSHYSFDGSNNQSDRLPEDV